MKNLIYLILIFSLFQLLACDKGFEDLNTNPNGIPNILPGPLFSSILLHTSGSQFLHEGSHLNYTATAVQHLAAATGNWTGDKFAENDSKTQKLFIDGYQFDIKLLTDLIANTENDSTLVNFNAIARIWRVFVFHRITDLYGDIPYFDSGKAASENLFTPSYDLQSEIYEDFFSELITAGDALDETLGSYGDADFIYKGDVKKWRMFANSLLLRLGFRILKVNPTKAEEMIQIAIQRGVMYSLEHTAYLRHEYGSALNNNGISAFIHGDGNARLNETLVDWMIANNDPRLPFIGCVVVDGQCVGSQKGLPNGFNIGDSEIDEIDTYSRLNWAVSNPASPAFFLTHGEVEFLLAEAIIRNIIPYNAQDAQDAQEHYHAGIQSAMREYEKSYLYIPYDALQNYCNQDFLSSDTDNAIQQINTQYWAATFLNNFETFANWRRSGYPVLSLSGDNIGKTIPRRLPYPKGEESVNGENLQEAIDRQGADDMNTRVWWDVE